MSGITIATVHVSVYGIYMCTYIVYIHTVDCNLKFKTTEGFVKQLCCTVDRYVYKIDIHNMGTSNGDVMDGDE